MLDVIKMLKPKQKAPPVKEEPKPEPKKSLLPLSTKGKVFAAIVALHVLFLAYFIWFLVSASITETEDEVASIMRGEVEITKTTQLMTFIVHSVRNYIGF